MYGLNKNPCDNSNANFRRIDRIDPNANEKWVTHGNSNLIFPYNLLHEDIIFQSILNFAKLARVVEYCISNTKLKIGALQNLNFLEKRVSSLLHCHYKPL